MFFDTGGYRQHVGIEDDVFGREAVFGQQFVGAAGDRDFPFESIGLTLFVEQHYDGRRSVTADQSGPVQELPLAFFQRDRVDYRFTLHAFEPRFEHFPFRRVDHDRDPCDVRFGHHEVQEVAHRRRAVDQPVIHADIDDLSAAFDLLPRYGQRFFVFFFTDQAGEFGRSGHVRPFADVDEVSFGRDPQRFQSAERSYVLRFRDCARRVFRCDLRDGGDVFRRRAAASADDVQQAFVQVGSDRCRHHFGRFVVTAEAVRQSGVRVRRYGAPGDRRQPFDVRQHQFGAVAAVQSYRKRIRMGDRSVESLDRLPGQRPSAGVGDGSGDHHRNPSSAFGESLLDGEQRGFRVQRVEDRLDQQHVRSAVQQTAHLFGIGCPKVVERHRPVTRIVDVRRDRRRAIGRADRTGYEARFRWIAERIAVGDFAGQRRRRPVHLINIRLEPVIGHRYRAGVERVGRDDVGSRFEIGFVDFGDHLRTGQHEQVVAPFQQDFPICKTRSAVILFAQAVALYHRSESAVEDQDSARALVVYRKFQHT